jgi:hypothetical protein
LIFASIWYKINKCGKVFNSFLHFAEDFIPPLFNPEIIFKSIRVKKKDDKYELWGTLTIHGVTKNIVVPFEILGQMTDPAGNTLVGVEAHLKLDRKDYGLTWNRTLDKGGVAVGNEVKIEILLEKKDKKKEKVDSDPGKNFKIVGVECGII